MGLLHFSPPCAIRVVRTAWTLARYGLICFNAAIAARAVTEASLVLTTLDASLSECITEQVARIIVKETL
jgi:hypothetical protein